MQNYLETIISQYSSDPVMLDYLGRENASIDPQDLFNIFYQQIWNLETAQGYGLDVWGRIVGVTRYLQLYAGTYFGFQEAGLFGISGWGKSDGSTTGGPWYSGESLLTPYTLSDADFLTLIYAKAASNIWDGSTPGATDVVLKLFPGRGNCYLMDNNDMTMTYNFEFALNDVDAAIIAQKNILPRPGGVLLTYSVTG